METKYSQLLFHLTLLNRASTVSEFHGSDSRELFVSNCAKSNERAELKRYGWLTREIQYKFNSQGFRCDEFDSRENFIALGCSFTEGVGVPVTEAWPAFLSQRVGLHGWNLGIGGTSVLSVARLLVPAIHALAPKFIAVFLPPKQRFDVVEHHGYATTFTPGDNKDAQIFHTKLASSYVKSWFANLANAELQFKMVEAYCTQVANEFNIPLIMLGSEETRSSLHAYGDVARDLMHDGPRSNSAIADKFFVQLTSLKV